MPTNLDQAPPAAADPTMHLSPDDGVRTSGSLTAVPDRIGPYVLGAKLGEGGMGSVYRATDGDGREVALKVLRPVLASEEGFAERFQREAQVAGKVRHENVVRLLDHGEHDGLHFMVFELLTGGDVGDLIKRRGVLTQAKALTVLRDAAKGLAAINAAGLVHRDIKPGNIFLDAGDQVRIGDLGLARGTDGDDRMTMTGVAMGTPAYMSPEHVQGIADIDIRTDIYALGATLYKMLTGQDPYIGDTMYMVTSQVLNDPIPDPRLIDPGITPEATAIIRKAMAKDRAQRYQVPEELVQDLEAALAGQRLLHAAVDIKPPKAAPGDKTRRHISDAAISARGGRMRGGRRLPTRLIRGLMLAMLLVGFAYALGKLPDLLTVPENRPPPIRPAWATDAGHDDHGPWATLSIDGTDVVLRLCPPGTFMMGSPPSQSDSDGREHLHQVRLEHGFWISTREVSQGLWRTVMGDNPATFSDDPERPIETVSWYDATDFCARLSQQLANRVVRLPTEAEWEYACRAGSTGSWGTAPGGPDTVAHFAPEPLRAAWKDGLQWGLDKAALDDFVGDTYADHIDDPRFRPLVGGSLQPNGWGLYDTHGNVGEWCLDAWDGRSGYPMDAGPDPVSESGDLRIVRGGSWYEPPSYGRAGARHGRPPDHADFDIGFRFVIEHDPAATATDAPAAAE